MCLPEADLSFVFFGELFMGALIESETFPSRSGHPLYYIFISTSTPDGKFKLISASTVFSAGSTMSNRRL